MTCSLNRLVVVVVTAVLLLDTASVLVDGEIQNIGSKSNFIQLLQSLMSQSGAYMPRLNPMSFPYAQPQLQMPLQLTPATAIRGGSQVFPQYHPILNQQVGQQSQQVVQPVQQQQQQQQQQQHNMVHHDQIDVSQPVTSTANLFNSDTCGKVRPQVTKYVSGGSPIDNQEHPWYVQIIIHNTDYAESETYCGGTLITPEWVLTAAHCYDDMRRERMARATNIIFRGLGNMRKYKAYADMIILHKDYVPALLPWEAEAQGLRPGPFNDLALIRLRTSDMPPSILKKLVPVCLPAMNTIVNEGTVCKVMGHGFMNSEDEKNFYMPPVLQAANVRISSNRECQDDVESRAIKEKINEKTTCVRGPIHPCVGDSGGPLLCTGKSRRHIDGSEHDAMSDEHVLSDDFKPRKWFLVGVTSFAVSTDGHDTCGTFKSAVFGLVATQLEWIRSTVLKNNGNHHHSSSGGGHYGSGSGFGHSTINGINFFN